MLDRFREIEARMGAATDGTEIVRLSKEHAELKPVAEAVQAIQKVLAEKPELEAMAADSLLARFIQRARELGMALYLDDPFNLQDPAQWQDLGMAGRW